MVLSLFLKILIRKLLFICNGNCVIGSRYFESDLVRPGILIHIKDEKRRKGLFNFKKIYYKRK